MGLPGINLNLGGVLNDVGEAAKKIRQAVVNDLPADKKAEYELELAKLEQASMLSQVELNKTEASSSNVFISGWRPFIGWICGLALALYFIAIPIIKVVNAALPMPNFDMGTLMPVVLSLLGLGGMRSFEKAKGVHDKH